MVTTPQIAPWRSKSGPPLLPEWTAASVWMKPWRSAEIYYLSVTAHGVLMAIVFTTFFIMGLGYVVTEFTLKRPISVTSS